MALKKYKIKEAYKFDERSKTQQEVIDVLLSAQQLRNFSPRTIEMAYNMYLHVCKLTKDRPIPIREYISSLSWEDIIDSRKWIELFYNSSMFKFLKLYDTNPIIRDFASEALEDEKLKYAFMKFIYEKKPKTLIQVEDYINKIKR